MPNNVIRMKINPDTNIRPGKGLPAGNFRIHAWLMFIFLIYNIPIFILFFLFNEAQLSEI